MAVSADRRRRRRLFFLSLMLLAWIAMIAFRLFDMQVLRYTAFMAKVKAQTSRVEDLHSKRGTITDRNGEVLAISLQSKSAFISNKDSQLSLGVLKEFCLRVPLSGAQKANVARRIRRGEKFIWVKRKLTDDEYAKVEPLARSAAMAGALDFLDEYRRVYPQKNIASHILGGVGIDEQALGGIETSLDGEIQGRGGRLKVLIDARRKIFEVKYLEQPVPGRDIHLSIDAALQFLVERELAAAVERHRASGGAVIVMESRSGQVLAMASYPDYFPERIWKIPPAVLKNKAISFLYDPGSTFKIVLAASALENGAYHPRETFDCHNGVYFLFDRQITDVHPFDRLRFDDVIIQSSNIGAAQIGQRLGGDKYYRTIRAFGFGCRTGIRLPAEENGIVHPPGKWSGVSLAFLSFGYEIAVTPLQMAAAFNVPAAGGFLVRPEILRDAPAGGLRKRVMSAPSQRRLTRILTAVVDRGTGKKAAIGGLAIAGKTGTAQKIKTGRYAASHIASFGGFFPAQDPQVTIFVMIDEPQGLYFGGDVAAPLFRAIAERLMPYLRLFPELPAQNKIFL
ncbi:MAG: penicillin-binding protein 2 [Candidatus Aminicenantes bacterium]|nr:penicillin-binding protein 2 [Candidatus Aminicenantes bacterium]